VFLTSPSKKGFGLDTLKQTEMVGRSFMAQFEILALERNPAHLKKFCVISYAKILLVGHGACVCYVCSTCAVYTHNNVQCTYTHTHPREVHIHPHTPMCCAYTPTHTHM